VRGLDGTMWCAVSQVLAFRQPMTMSLSRIPRTGSAAACVGVLVTVLVIAACGGVAAAKPKPTPPHPPSIPGFVPKGPKAARHIALQNAAIRLINRANRRAFATRPSCKPSFPHPSSKTTHDVPSSQILDAIAAFRRPAVAADAFPARNVGAFGGPFGGQTYVDYTRSVTSASGKSFYLGVARSVPYSYHSSAACLDLEHQQLVKLLAGEPATLRSAALKEFGQIRHSVERTPAASTTPRDTLWFFTKGPGGAGLGGGGGGTPAAYFLTHGMFMSSGGGSGSSTISGLVPDGVASVTFQYPRVVSNGRWYKPTVYPSAYTRTVRVAQNVLSLHVPRDIGAAFPPRMVWRAADGTIVRVIKQPRR